MFICRLPKVPNQCSVCVFNKVFSCISLPFTLSKLLVLKWNCRPDFALLKKIKHNAGFKSLSETIAIQRWRLNPICRIYKTNLSLFLDCQISIYLYVPSMSPIFLEYFYSSFHYKTLLKISLKSKFTVDTGPSLMNKRI